MNDNFLIPKTRFRDKSWTAGMRHKNCTACGDEDCVGHHIGHDRLNDRVAVPLCNFHHGVGEDSVHAATSEAVWWARMTPDIVMSAMKLWAQQQYEMENEDDTDR